MFTLNQLQGFVAVAEEGNVSRAAKRLHLTQPPLSRQIHQLEECVGTPLLHRHVRGTSLTPAGRAFLFEARRLLSLAEAAPLNVRRVADGTYGTIRLGFTSVTGFDILGRWVRLSRDQLPGVALVLSELVTGAQIERLLAGDLDVGLLRGPVSHDVLETRRIHTEALLLAAPENNVLLKLCRAPTLVEIGRYDVITYSPVEARYFFELVATTFGGAGIAPHYAQQVGQVVSILALVAAGIGVALVPESAARLQLPGVAFAPIEGIAPDCVEVRCAWRSSNDSPALRSLLQLTLGKELENRNPA